MAAAALLVLATLAAAPVTVSAQKDCHVQVTGPDQQWTPVRRLEWIPTTAPPTNHQFPGRPPGRSELSFSVLSRLSRLEIRLLSSRLPGGYLLRVTSTHWRARRTFVGGVYELLASGAAPPDRVVADDEWSSYAVSVTRPDTVRLQRLYDNGTRQLWLELRHPEASSVDLASARVVPPAAERAGFRHGTGIGPVATGDWGFWKFDCSTFYYQTAELCHLWPSWPSDVPLQFRTPHRRSSPVTGVSVLLNSAGTAELHLLESPERFYQVTLTSSELILGRAERGVPGARTVASSCFTAPPAAEKAFRLLWVSILHGIISVGLEGAYPCTEATAEVTPSATEGPTTENNTWPTLLALDEVTEMTSDLTNMASEVTEAQELTSPQATSTSSPVRTTLVSWKDGLPYFVSTYGVRTPDEEGLWAVECQPNTQPNTDKSSDEDKMSQLPKRGGFAAVPTGRPGKDTDGGDSSRRGCRSQQPFLLATVILAVAAVVLLLVVVLLVTALVSQRRRWSAELAAQRRLSLVSTDLFTAPMAPAGADGDHEYAELHLYDSVRPMSVQPGESTFKPRRRQATAAPALKACNEASEATHTVPAVTQDGQTLEQVPVFQGVISASGKSVSTLEGTAPMSKEAVSSPDGTVPVPADIKLKSEDVESESEHVQESRGTPETREASVEPLPVPPEDI